MQEDADKNKREPWPSYKLPSFIFLDLNNIKALATWHDRLHPSSPLLHALDRSQAAVFSSSYPLTSLDSSQNTTHRMATGVLGDQAELAQQTQ